MNAIDTYSRKRAVEDSATFSAQCDWTTEGIHDYCELLRQGVLSTSTISVKSISEVEPDLIPYQCCVSSGVLDFWRDESEDVYTSEDGEPL